MRRTLVLLVAVLGVLAAGAAAAPAQGATAWLCRPGLAANPCQTSLRTTVFEPFGTARGVVTPRRPAQPPIDCFYVYPTVSDQQGPVATKARDPEIRDIALYQAARFSEVCRVYAPLYRQLTVPALFRGNVTAADARVGQQDVIEAWRTYLRLYNHGRGVVLLGHSQGSYRLEALIRNQIEPDRRVRSRVVSAILLGGNVTVRRGSDRGGVFRRLRACRTATQVGCVVAFSTFDEVPPPNALFGRVSTRLARALGLPTGANLEVLCTNPGRLGGGSAPLDFIVPTKPYAPGTLIAAGILITGLSVPPGTTTPWVEVRNASTGRCSRAAGAHVLRVSAGAGTPDPHPSPDATWGLHLLDGNIALGDLVRLVRSQSRAYARARR